MVPGETVGRLAFIAGAVAGAPSFLSVPPRGFLGARRVSTLIRVSMGLAPVALSLGAVAGAFPALSGAPLPGRLPPGRLALSRVDKDSRPLGWAAGMEGVDAFAAG